MVRETEHNAVIDIAKFVASLLVIAIHTALFEDVSESLYFVFNLLMCRQAVPFFAVCSGYFLSKKFREGNLTTLFGREKKLISFYAFWSLFYFLYLLPVWIRDDYLTISNIVGFLKSCVWSASFYHLWYVLDVIYALPLFYFCVRYFDVHTRISLSLLIWGIYAVGYGYLSFFPFLSSFYSLINLCSASSAQFVILPYLLIGSCLVELKQNSTAHDAVCLSVAFLFLIIESLLLRRYAGISVFTRILMVLPVSYFLFRFLQHSSAFVYNSALTRWRN